MNDNIKTNMMRAAAALLVLGGLYVITLIFAAGQLLIGTGTLVVFSLAVYVFWSSKAYNYRYLFPGLLGIGLFVVLPLVYTVRISFSNRNSSNLKTLERVINDNFLTERYRLAGTTYAMSMYRDGESYRLVLEALPLEALPLEALPEEDAVEDPGDSPDGDGADDDGGDWDDFEGDGADDAGDDATGDDATGDDATGDDEWADFEGGGDGEEAGEGGGDGGDSGDEWAEFEGEGEGGDGGDGEQAIGERFVTEAIALDIRQPTVLSARPLAGSGFQLTPDGKLGFGEINRNRDIINLITVRFAPDNEVVSDSTDLELFVHAEQKYTLSDDNKLTDTRTGEVLTPDFEVGFYRDASGEPVTPGFEVDIGFAHYMNILTNEGLREPFIKIFIWTLLFSGLTVLFTLIVGFGLAELMSWEALRFRGVYQIFLFLPYAVPGFISILVFKGLFNENTGEINLILSSLLGIKPEWFSDPFLAKAMILIVNTWLGYPYIMLLCMGLRKSIPGDLYEASSVEGASAWDNIVTITWPLIRKPLMPLLVSSFAFNFNNFVLIYLLTGGRPDIIGTQYPAGETDILVSYTYRLAFQGGAGNQYGLAGAIATLIFIMVAALSVLNLKLTRVQAEESQR